MVKEMNQVTEGYKNTELGKIPVEWEVVNLENLAEINRGASPRPIKDPKWFSEESKIGWVRIADVTKSKRYLCQTVQYLSDEGVQKSRYVKHGDLIMSICATIGRPVIMAMEACIHDGFVVFNNMDVNRIDKNFLIYILNSLEDYFKGQGQPGTQVNINTTIVGKTSIALPSIKEQQKIAEILSTVDEQIENIDQIITKTKELKKGLMQQLLTKGIGHTEFKQSELGEIPTDWEVIALEEVSKILRGASPRPKGDPRYYGGNIPRLMIADITRDGKFVTPQIDFLTEEGAKKSRPMPKGTFVVACSGTYVGYPSILNVDSCIHDGIIAIVDFENSFDIEYLYYVFTRLYNELNSSATHGGVFNNLTTQIIKEFKIVKPSLEEQQKIAEILSAVDAEIKGYEQEKEKYTELKKGLMQQLLTGKIRVTV